MLRNNGNTYAFPALRTTNSKMIYVYEYNFVKQNVHFAENWHISILVCKKYSLITI